jgi:hypothetical protein
MEDMGDVINEDTEEWIEGGKDMLK